MKGVVFTEFLEMVEETFSPELVDDIIEDAGVDSGGAYTAVATYDHAELVALVVALGRRTKTPVSDLVRTFGRHLLGRFAVLYPQFFDVGSAFEFLQSIETHIHVEVQKLYPDAELPHFECLEMGAHQLEMIYSSKRSFGDLAYGLIEGCGDHFGETLVIEREDLPSDEGSRVRFLLTTQSAVAHG